ncbi:putative transcription factor interactor and regulator CCHC(Zn) family [Helianthus annuus]|nr:putative transcription factor interactor and regulator CCHC(Zn) family [Helianthus annuus]
MLEQIEENPEIPVKAVQEQFQRRYSVGISRMKAYRAKCIAKKHVEGDYAEQYTILRDYAHELIQQNPGTTVKIEVDGNPDPGDNTRQFRRIYVCLAALKQGFKAIGRDFLGLDGAFMKGPFPGQLLSAVGVDCNNGIYPVAYAIVESENKESWTWFLEILGDDLGLGTYSNFTFISDRQKGILPAISKLFPCAEHRYCLRHIHENMKVTFKGDLYKEKLWKCACATTVPELGIAMDELKAFNKKAHLWLSKIPPLHWSRAYFSGRAVSGIVLNNMCEVFNGKIVEGRDKPIISALEYIREYLMRRIVTVLNVIEKSEGLLTPKATELLEGIKRDATAYHVQWNGGDLYQVSGKPNHARVVNLAARTCSCRAWEVTGMPCRHAVAAIWEKAANGGRVGALESWVHPVHTMERWKEVYSFRVNPINGRTLWTRVNAPTTITPPKHHTQVGRPKKLRKRSAVELEEMTQSGRLSKKHTKGACSKCKKTGHNSRTCKGQGEAVKTGKSGKSGNAGKKRKAAAK